jgi:hypothetical protein
MASVSTDAISRRGARAAKDPDNQYSVLARLSFGLTTVLAIEPFDATCRIDQLLFAGKERVAV